MKRTLILRDAKRDGVLIALSGIHAGLLVLFPSWWLIGLLFLWNSNTISHHFIHQRFFRPGWMNHAFSAWLSLLLGIPQRLWRDRHLAHHGNRPFRLKSSRVLWIEVAFVLSLHGLVAWKTGMAVLTIYWPGLAFGLLLAWLQGYYEHAGGTRSHYGTLYNVLFFNDGYHVEHHLHPGMAWNQLNSCSPKVQHPSRWPAVLRWLDGLRPKNEAG